MIAGKSQSIAASEMAPGPFTVPFEAMPGDWHVLHTRSRQEKVVAEELEARQFVHFLPSIRHTRVYGGRKSVVEEPMFPGYVFLKGTLSQAYEADRTRRVARIIPVVDQEQLESELKSLWIALENQVALDPFPYLRCGMRVEVRSGPLRGVQGLIETRIGVSRLILQVQMLGRAVALEVDGALLEPA
jgi:transcription antitermination factor NusG